jgi:hypothetical protein
LVRPDSGQKCRGEDIFNMRAIISEKLQAYLQQVGSTVLTVTLDPLRC